MTYTSPELLALAIAVSFAAGLNVYAVVATLGLLAQADMVVLPEAIAVVESWWLIGLSLTLYAIEFLADKVPLFDLVWNVLQLFVRVPIAAVLAFAATDRLSPELQIIAAVAGGTLALAASSGKLALRSAATTSPEPLSNILLSIGEDVLAIGLTWFATQYPWLAAGIAIICLIFVIALAALVVRGVRAMFSAARRQAGWSAPTSTGGSP